MEYVRECVRAGVCVSDCERACVKGVTLSCVCVCVHSRVLSYVRVRVYALFQLAATRTQVGALIGVFECLRVCMCERGNSFMRVHSCAFIRT